MVVNPSPDLGQFSSLQVGLREVLNHGRDAAMVTLVDRPPVRETSIRTLTEAFNRAAQHFQWGAVPRFQGKHGHPFIAGRELIEAFLQAPPTANAREIRYRYSEKIVFVDVDDPMSVANINTPEEYSLLVSQCR